MPPNFFQKIDSHPSSIIARNWSIQIFSEFKGICIYEYFKKSKAEGNMKCSIGKSAICILLLACLIPRIAGIELFPSSWLKRWSAWLSSSPPKDSDDSNPEDVHDELSDFDPEHVPYQLSMVVCPAATGKDLKDYWRCLWGSSLTSEGMEQERRGLVEAYSEAANQRPVPGYFVRKKEAEAMKQREAQSKQEKVEATPKGTPGPGGIFPTGNVEHPSSKERQGGGNVMEGGAAGAAEDWVGEVDITTVNENSPEGNVFSTSSSVRSKRVKRDDTEDVKGLLSLGFKKYAKVFAWESDLKNLIQDYSKRDEIRKCQEDVIKPGMSLTSFISCLRDKSKLKLSRWPEFQDLKYPDVNIPYDPREFRLLDLDLGTEDEDHHRAEKYTLRFGYDRIQGDVDEVTDFSGADPYLLEQVGDFRYRFDNLKTDQQSPAWSYIGQNDANSWHKQDLKKFFIPLQSDADLRKAAFLADLAQTYPGLGEIAAQDDKGDTPMDYRWQKDSGYHSHTRYLLPLLVRNDLTYFKYKKVIDDSVTLKPDSEVIDDIIHSLEHFLNVTKLRVDDNRYYPTVQDIPFLQTYRDFLAHYYGVDISSLILEQKEFAEFLITTGQVGPDFTVSEENARINYELFRTVNRYYVEAVMAQQKCMKEMVDKYDYRREGEDVEELLTKAKENCLGKGTADSFKVPENYLGELYQKYFDRKEARQAYSLPGYPIEFPLCKHNEQSPIDIITSKGRESSLRAYEFGGAGYRLNRFFMTVPNDGTPLLTVGIFQGERLDDSSVKLSGGAVKGQNLTFQYMFLKFSNGWREVGSEHRFDGVGAPMEIQMVFTLAGSADDIKYWHILARVQNQLFQFRGKLVIILSVLVDVLIDDETVIKTIEEKKTNQDPYVFEPLAQAAYHFQKEYEAHPKSDVPRGYVSKDPTFRLTDFIPKEEASFYTYRGSLTWPPCFGYVLWSVYDKRLYMSKRQFDQFSRLPALGTSDSTVFGDNSRSPGKIHVEEEEVPNLSFEKREALIAKRTVDRYVLKGKHNPALQLYGDDEAGIVDEEGYHEYHIPESWVKRLWFQSVDE